MNSSEEPYYNRTSKKRKPNEVPSLAETPEIMRFWDAEHNEDPSTIKANFTGNVNLLCSNCGYRWQSSPVNFLRNSMKCPACEMHRAVQPGVTDVFTLVPDLEKYYDYSKNTAVDPTKLGVGSREIVYWKCPSCGREWQAPINTRLIKENGIYRAKQCRTCYLADSSRYTPVSSIPALVRYWDFDRNEVDINLTPSFSETDVNWRCKECGFQWVSSPKDRIRASGECPCCGVGKRIMPGYNDALTKHPELEAIYDPTLNPGKNLSNMASTSDDLFTWKCRSCGYSWEASVTNTIISAGHCPNCLNRRAIPGTNSLADKRPDIACMWSEKNEKDPSEVLTNSYYWATWVCQCCGGEFRAYVADIVSGKAHCPYCTGEKILPGVNSFKAKHPDLMMQWNYTSNYALLDPDTIGDNCRTTVWWTCKSGDHAFPMSPHEILLFQKRKKKPCPFCKGRRRKKHHFI